MSGDASPPPAMSTPLAMRPSRSKVSAFGMARSTRSRGWISRSPRVGRRSPRAEWGREVLESGWLAGRIIASLLTVIPVVVVVDILAYVVGDVRLDAASWLVLTVIVVVGSIPIALIGLIVGLVFREESAQAGDATGPLVGLVIRTVIIGAATLVIYRRSAE